MTTDITELAQMKGQKVEGSYYLAECTDCGKMYPSNKLNGGEPLFSGDYGECYCPHCGADDAAIGDCGDTAATAWNYQQGRIDALVEALEKAQTINAAAEKLVRCKGRYHSEQNYRALAALFGVTTPDLPPLDGEPVGEVIEVGDALLVEWHKNLEEGAKLYTAPQAPVMPFGLHPDTQKLVTDFCTALAEKLYKAQLKYGYDTDWKQDGWPSQCQAHFHQHIAKGDPRDVAAYCAFMWYHGWKTEAAQTAPVVTFYRDGIEAAAKWIDKQREAYDSEHGRYDTGTGFFEFGNDAQREYSSTLEELAEGIRALHPNAGNSPAIPEGYVMVPKEATEEMLIAGLEEADPLGSLIDWDASRGDCNTRKQVQEIFKAMLAAAPQEVKGE